MEHHHWKRCIEYSRYGDLHHRCDTIFALVQYTPQPPSSSRKHGIIRSSFPQLQQRHRPLQVPHPEELALIYTCGHGELLCAYLSSFPPAKRPRGPTCRYHEPLPEPAPIYEFLEPGHGQYGRLLDGQRNVVSNWMVQGQSTNMHGADPPQASRSFPVLRQ